MSLLLCCFSTGHTVNPLMAVKDGYATTFPSSSDSEPELYPQVFFSLSPLFKLFTSNPLITQSIYSCSSDQGWFEATLRVAV